jgi:hypothetical protein
MEFMCWNAAHSGCSMEDTKEKPFVCSCGRSFTRTDLLKRHIQLSRAGQPSVLLGLRGSSWTGQLAILTSVGV